MRLGEDVRKEGKESSADDSAASVTMEKRTKKKGQGHGNEGGGESFPFA
jgi:hypothetical protein